MQLGLRLHDAMPGTLEDRLSMIKQQGFTCAHVALSKVINEYSVSDTSLTPGLAMHLRRLFQKSEIDFAVLGCYLNLAHPGTEELNKILHTYLSHIRFASLLGCGVVGTETGAPNPEYRFEEACKSEEALTTLINNLKYIVNYAEKMGVIVAIEPVRNHIVYDAKRARRVLDEIASPNLQIIFDPVNLLGMDNYKQQNEVIEEALDLLGDDIAVVHMKDFIVKENYLQSIAAGLGELNHRPIVQFIKAKKTFIHCTLEDTQPDNAVAAKDFIKELYNSIEQ